MNRVDANKISFMYTGLRGVHGEEIQLALAAVGTRGMEVMHLDAIDALSVMNQPRKYTSYI